MYILFIISFIKYVCIYTFVYTIDSETTYEIIRALKLITSILRQTAVISLLQPTPEVFYSFDELILMGK